MESATAPDRRQILIKLVAAGLKLNAMHDDWKAHIANVRANEVTTSRIESSTTNEEAMKIVIPVLFALNNRIRRFRLVGSDISMIDLDHIFNMAVMNSADEDSKENWMTDGLKVAETWLLNHQALIRNHENTRSILLEGFRDAHKHCLDFEMDDHMRVLPKMAGEKIDCCLLRRSSVARKAQKAVIWAKDVVETHDRTVGSLLGDLKRIGIVVD